MDVRARPDRNNSLPHAINCRELLSITGSVKRRGSPENRERRPNEPSPLLNGEETFGKYGRQYAVAVKNVGYYRSPSIKKELQDDSPKK